MSRGRRIAVSVAVALGLVVLIVAGAVLFLTQTDTGREQVRRIVLGQLEQAVDGEVRIGRIEGNLLRRIRLVDVSIVDAQGRPFLRADTVSTGFSLRGLLRQRLVLRDFRLVNADVVLDKPPGEEWNWVRIFPTDPEAEVVESARPGWGDWIELRPVVLVNSRVVVRTEWQPPEGLSAAEREEALRVALSEDSRENVVPVPGGYQNVMDFRELNAEMPYVRPAHPDSVAIPIEVASFSGIVQPFRPPAAVVRDLSGSFRIANDSLFFDGVQAVLPGSRLAAEGVYALEQGGLLLRLNGAPVAFADLRWLYPPLPEEGGGNLRMTLRQGPLSTRIVAEEVDLRTGGAELAGRADVTLGDTLRLQDTDLRFRSVDTRLVRRLAPEVQLPREGVLSGRVQLAGRADALRVDGDVRFDDALAGPSRVLAAGRLGLGEEVRFTDLRVRVQPLQAELVRAFVPQLPLRGTITGVADLDGSPSGLLRLASDLTLRDPRAGLSRVRAAGGVDLRDELRLQDLRVRFDPLRLDLVRDEVPQLPAGAALSGQLRLDGAPSRALRLAGDLALDDPRTGISRLTLEGGVAMADELTLRDLRLHAHPVRLDLARPWIPDLPAGAVVEGTARLDGVPQRRLRVDAALALRDPRAGLSRVRAAGGVDFGDGLRFDAFDIRLDPLRVDLLRGRLPDLPPGGALSGELRLDGSPERLLDVRGELAHSDAALGTSRVAISGGVGTADELRFRDLDLRFSPLRLELVRAFAPDAPIGGTLEGTAALDGSPASRLGFELDLAHRWGAERSQVAGRGEVVTGPQGWAAVDLRLEPLSLATVGRFAPAAGLRGSVSGRVRAQGDLGDLAFSADLRSEDGGELAGQGSLDLAGEEPGYSIDLGLERFDLAALTARAPAATDLTGSASARGRGTDPATMSAALEARFVGSSIDDLAADEVRVRAAVEAGLARVDSALIRLGAAEAELAGSFGLTAARHGELAYRVRVDSLHAFAGWVPGSAAGVSPPDTAGVPGPPLDPALARADTAADAAVDGLLRTGGVTRVRYPGSRRDDSGPEPLGLLPPLAARDTARADSIALAGRAEVPADSLAGSLRAEGTLRGNLTDFALRGTAEAEDLVVAGNEVGGARAAYTLAGVGTPAMNVELDAEAHAIRAAGMALDSAEARVRYRGDRQGAGRATLAAFADEDTDLRLDAEFALSLERSEVRLADLALRIDTVAWRSARPGVVAWGGAGIEVDSLELVGSHGGRIFVDGRLPADEPAALEVVVRDIEVGHLADLAQADLDLSGRLSLDATVGGTQRSPEISGAAALLGGAVGERALPDTRLDFGYADRRLTSTVELTSGGQLLATAEAEVPVDLGLVGGIEQRLLDAPLVVDVRADSLPLDMVPELTDQVQELRGRVRGTLAVRGTPADPVLSGVVDLDLGSFVLAPLGVRFTDIGGTLRLDDDVAVVDSLVAWSGGPIRVGGAIGLPDLTTPVLDLTVDAREAWVIDSENARLQVDADIAVVGPLAAVEVTGEVRARSGVAYIPTIDEMGSGDVVDIDDPATFTRVDTFFAAERRTVTDAPGLIDGLQLDLGILVDRDVWLRSTEANIEIYTPAEVGPLRVRMDGGLATLAMEGTVNTDRGTYEFMGRRFVLTRGAVTFQGEPEFNPFIQVVAEHEVQAPGREAFQIRVVIGGTLQELSLAVESSAQPPISQTDLLSYLAFGRDASSLLQFQGSTLSGEGGASGGLVGNVAGIATQQLASVALDELVSGLERDAARSLGLDVVRITPADVPPEVFSGRYIDVLRGTEIEAGRYLTPRLFVAGQARPAAVPPGARVEYRTPQGFLWVTTWQPRFLPVEPTLAELEARQANVFGAFLFREWRF